MRKLLVALSLTLLVLPTLAWGMGSTTNTDFEAGFQASGVANGWEAFAIPGTGPAVTCSAESTIIHQGAWSQKVDATVGEGGVKAKIDVTAGRTYNVSLWVRVDSGAGYISIMANGEENAELAAGWIEQGADSTWHKITQTVTATGAGITIFCDDWAGVAYFDEITVTEVVQPQAPYMIWSETVYHQGAGFFEGSPAGNPIGHGQVLIDGTKSIIAEGQGGVLLYDDHQTNGTAFIKTTPFWAYFFDPADPGWPATSNYSTKAATLLGGRLYSSTMKCQIHQSTLPTWEGAMTTNDGPWGSGMNTGRVESDCTGLVTDGTYLYGSDNPGAFAIGPSYVYKWSVNPAGNGGNGSLTEIWKVQIPTGTWLISIGYYNGKLYAAEGFRGRQVYEIDCATGAYTALLSGDNLIPEVCGTDAWYMGQIARCGNRMVLANWTGHLTQWQQIDGTWTLVSCHGNNVNPGYPAYLLGLSLKPGPDGNAKYAWASGSNIVYFYDLTPFSSQVGVGEARKAYNNYPVAVKDAVVTKVGTGEFWVEDQDRNAGLRVAWTGTMPTVDTKVEVNGGAAGADSGERVINAVSVTPGAAATVAPLFVTHKNLGPATGSAGLANDGMLVKVTGKLTFWDTGNNLYIDDGSAVANDLTDGTKGLKIVLNDIQSFPNYWDLALGYPTTTFNVTLVGVVRLDKLANGTIVPRVDVRADADVTLTAL